MKLLKLIGLRTGIIAVALFVAFGFVAPAVQNYLPRAVGDMVTTIGMAGEAYAATPDYICDGTDDNVQVQLALDSLPATGGKIILFGGNYAFSATVSRAINNVTIEGSGKSTYIAYDGATAVFSAGVQTGWIYATFATDTGWVTTSSAGDTILEGPLWNNGNLISNVVASGATMPASPVTGQQFLQDTTGRVWLYQYDGSDWQPITAFGDTVLYVDPSGTDDQNHGSATGADAFETIQFAYDSVPKTILNGNVDIYLSANTFAENLTITQIPAMAAGKDFSIAGTLTTDASLVATGGASGSGTTTARVSGTFSAHAHTYKLCRFTSGTNANAIRVVGQTTTTNIYLVGASLSAVPGAGDTYDILSWGTQITGEVNVMGGAHAYSNVGSLRFKYIQFNGPASPSYNTFYANDSYVGLAACKVVGNASAGLLAGVRSAVGNYLNIHTSIIDTRAATSPAAVWTEWNAQTDLISSVVVGKDDNTGTGVMADMNSSACVDGSDVSGYFFGTLSQRGSVINCDALYGVNSFIHNCSQKGSYSRNLSSTHVTADVVYGTLLDGTADANADDTDADAATFGITN